MQSQFGQYRLTKCFMTVHERLFYTLLVAACEDRFVVFPKVRLADVVQPVELLYGDWHRLRALRLDFLLCDAVSLEPQLAIEFDELADDVSPRVADPVADCALFDAGLSVLRFSKQPEYDPSVIGLRIFGACGVCTLR